MFKYNCVVKSGDMNIITVLVNIGYKSKGNFNMDASRYLQTYAEKGIFEEVDIPEKDSINCKDNMNKFLTIAAMRYDSDKDQLITDGINCACCPWKELDQHIVTGKQIGRAHV